jgi:hypothetical protein
MPAATAAGIAKLRATAIRILFMAFSSLIVVSGAKSAALDE